MVRHSQPQFRGHALHRLQREVDKIVQTEAQATAGGDVVAVGPGGETSFP